MAHPPRVAAQAVAEPSAAQLELARAMFYYGVELLDRGEFAEAADRLHRVLEIRDSAVVSYHLASALSRLGRHVEALQLLQTVHNDPDASADIRRASDKLLPKVERSVGRLTLRVSGERESIRILVNEREMPLVALDVPVPVDPGEVSVVALRDGEQVAASSARVGGPAGLRAEIVLEIPAPALPEPVPEPVPDSAAQPTPRSAPGPLAGCGHRRSRPRRNRARRGCDPAAPRRDEDSGLLGKWWFWTAVGVVAAGAAVATVALSSDGGAADLSQVRGDFEPGLLEGRVE